MPLLTKRQRWALLCQAPHTAVLAARLTAQDAGRVAVPGPGRPPLGTARGRLTSRRREGVRARRLLTDLFYYERRIRASSSLITALTSDNFTPLLFNGNITHAILEMEKHFHVLLTSEMMYGTSRLRGVRGGQEELTEPRAEGRGAPRLALFYFSVLKEPTSWDAGERSPHGMDSEAALMRSMLPRQV